MSYGFLDEFHQYFVPGRYVPLIDIDICINIVGILAIICIYKLSFVKKDQYMERTPTTFNQDIGSKDRQKYSLKADSSVEEHPANFREVVGSNPAPPTINPFSM